MKWRERILEKINALPEPQKTKALQDFEIHEYCTRKERRHNCLIEDVPHPVMAVDDETGEWII